MSNYAPNAAGALAASADEIRQLYSRIAALEAENARLRKFKNEGTRILQSLTSGVIRVMEEQLDQSRKVAAQMQKEIEDFTETGGE